MNCELCCFLIYECVLFGHKYHTNNAISQWNKSIFRLVHSRDAYDIGTTLNLHINHIRTPTYEFKKNKHSHSIKIPQHSFPHNQRVRTPITQTINSPAATLNRIKKQLYTHNIVGVSRFPFRMRETAKRDEYSWQLFRLPVQRDNNTIANLLIFECLCASIPSLGWPPSLSSRFGAMTGQFSERKELVRPAGGCCSPETLLYYVR